MFLVIFDNSNLDVLINFVLIKKKSVVGCVNFSKASKIIKHNPGNYQVLLRDFRTTFIFLIRQM